MIEIKTALVTGANAGLGKEAARQLALNPSVVTVYLGCRNEERAKAAKEELEAITGRKIFRILQMDLSSSESVRSAVDLLPESIDALIMNAGGTGGTRAFEMTSNGVLQIFAINILGHVVLTEALVETGKLKRVAVLAGSEAARGIPAVGMARPDLPESSIDDFASIADGSLFSKPDPNVAYGPVKYVGALWMSAMARKHPGLRFVTVSPGATYGTNAADELPGFQRFLFTRIAFPLMKLFGRAHNVDTGARRYLDALVDDEQFKSGHFYASSWPTTSGELVDQGTVFSDLNNESFQDNAAAAIHRFI